jgi:hypothetical protein
MDQTLWATPLHDVVLRDDPGEPLGESAFRELGATEGCESFFNDTVIEFELVDEDDTTYSDLDCP